MLFWQQNSEETLTHMGVHTHAQTYILLNARCSLYELAESQREKHKSNIDMLV